MGQRKGQRSASGPVTLEKELANGCQMVPRGVSRHQKQAGVALNRSQSNAKVS